MVIHVQIIYTNSGSDIIIAINNIDIYTIAGMNIESRIVGAYIGIKTEDNDDFPDKFINLQAKVYN